MSSTPVSLRFLGASQTVTGSRYLLTCGDRRVLIDCGLFQGLKSLRLRNWEPFPIDPASLDAVVLTHAHIDHSGYIPRLIAEGFRGKVYCTPATWALCKILLPDTGYLQEEEAQYFNKKRISKHDPALPLFTMRQAEQSLERFRGVDFHQDFSVTEGVQARFLYAGHILGAALLVIRVGGLRLGFSGDLGRPRDPVLAAPERMPEVDYLVVESTYGDRLHVPSDPQADLADAINTAYRRSGVVLIPAFTVGRMQTVMHFLTELKSRGKIPRELPMYVNSPMGTNVTDLFAQFPSLHKLTPKEVGDMREAFRFVSDVEESKRLNRSAGPKIILSASGMATGGRILHHLMAFAPLPETMILLTGFQALGTRGRFLADGAPEIKIFGRYVPVKAEVRQLDNLSAHADSDEILNWLKQIQKPPRRTFVTHGEPVSARTLKENVTKWLGWECVVPELGAEFLLEEE